MTTNGLTLSRDAGELKAAGLNRVNISLDSLDSARFAALTGQTIAPADFPDSLNVLPALTGDTATGRTMCFNPMKLSGRDAGDKAGGQIMFCALWYDDEFVRTADGWRMTRRVEAKCMDKIF